MKRRRSDTGTIRDRGRTLSNVAGRFGFISFRSHARVPRDRVGTLGDLPVYGMALARVPWPLQVVVGAKGVRMSNVISLADARRGAEVPTIVEEAQQMIDLNGRWAGLIAAAIAKMPDTPDEDRAYWVALAEEIARIEGYSWYVPDVDELRVVDRRAPGRLPGRKEKGASGELAAPAPAAGDAAPGGHSQ
jgi:hypothetical protein